MMTTSNRSAGDHRRRSYNRLSSVMTPIENSAQWRELLAKSKSEEGQADEVVVSGEINRRRARTQTPETMTSTSNPSAGDRRRRSYNRLSSVMTPIENSAQWRELLAKSKSEEEQADEVVVSGRANRRRAGFSSVLTPIENSAQWKSAIAGKPWRSATAESAAEKSLDDGAVVVAEQAVDLSFKEWLHGAAK